MKAVLFNDLILQRPMSGIGQYALQLLEAYPEVAPDLDVVRVSTLRPVRWVSHLMRRVSGAQSAGVGRKRRLRPPVGRLKQWAQAGLDPYMRWAARGDWGLVHEPDAIAFESSSPTLVSVMDLSVVRFPEWHPSYRVKKYERNFMRTLDRAVHFITISESIKQEMVDHLGVPSQKVTAIPLAARAAFRPQAHDAVQTVKARHGLPERYFVFVGNLEPRKNLSRLLRAYSRLPSSLRADCPLVLVGGWGWNTQELQAMLERSPWRESVRRLGYLPDAELVCLVQGALAMVYPSLYEGFGLPTLEAMAVGTPVVASSVAGLKEAVGSAALIVDPEDETALATALRQVAQEPALRERLREQGYVQVKRFSWKQTAIKTADVYRKLGRH